MIRKSPSSETVFLHHKAVFSCVTRDGTTHWRVNDTDLPSELHADLVTDQASVSGLDLFTLTIPGRAEYNGTRVQCVTEDGGDSVESSIATLQIQGMHCNHYQDSSIMWWLKVMGVLGRCCGS